MYPYRLHRSCLSLSRQQVKKLLAGSTTTMLSELGPSPEKQPVEGLKGPNTGPALKLIFLDVDGVICCNGAGRLENDKLKRISKVVEETGAKIVLSTDWRRDPSLKAIITTALGEVGCTVIGATRKGPPLKPVRPQEITGWLDAFLEKGREVTEWVAVDDRELIGEMGGDRLKGHFVNTSFASGLTDRAAERMIAVLNGDHEQGMGAFTPSSGTLRKGPGAGRRTPSPARATRKPAAGLVEGDAPAAAPAGRGEGGFRAATAPGGAHSSVGRAPAPAAARAGGRPGARPGGRTPLGPGAGRPGAQSPTSAKARTAAFGAAQPGLHSPTCARASMSSTAPPPSSSSSADAPAASGEGPSTPEGITFSKDAT